ncbi:unnamed protein product, partial [Ectocarpus sp. 12 AP-2014]
ATHLIVAARREGGAGVYERPLSSFGRLLHIDGLVAGVTSSSFRSVNIFVSAVDFRIRLTPSLKQSCAASNARLSAPKNRESAITCCIKTQQSAIASAETMAACF